MTATLLPAKADDVLKLDEVWSFVLKKTEKRWLWTAICRHTRQIVAFVTSERSEATLRLLQQAIPLEYKRCQTYSDFRKAYSNVFPKETHHSVAKKVVKPITWSVGITHSDNQMPVIRAKYYPFRKPICSTTW